MTSWGHLLWVILKTHLFINMKISIIAGARYLKKALLFAKIPIVIVDIIFSLPRCCAAIFFLTKKASEFFRDENFKRQQKWVKLWRHRSRRDRQKDLFSSLCCAVYLFFYSFSKPDLCVIIVPICLQDKKFTVPASKYPKILLLLDIKINFF